uniref:hypothetical protein n=1 Tax=Segatella copri TaxID=165179 RepID=UPI001F2A935D
MTKIAPALTHGIKTSVFTDIKDMDKALGVLARAGQKVQMLSHRIAISVLVHSFTHNDPSYTSRMVAKLHASLPEMARKNALLDWMNEYGNFTVSEEKGALVVVMQKDVKPRLAEADGKPFWKFSPEPEYKPLDREKFFDMMIKKMQTDAKKL